MENRELRHLAFLSEFASSVGHRHAVFFTLWLSAL
jgi:hypothetical protein